MGGKLKFNLHHSSSQNTPCLTVILAEALLEMSTCKCEKKKNRDGKSRAPRGERETSSATLQPRRGVHFLPVLSCPDSCVLFSPWHAADLCTLPTCHFKIPPPSSLFLILKCLCIYFKMNFSTPICCFFAFQLNRFSSGWYGV